MFNAHFCSLHTVYMKVEKCLEYKGDYKEMLCRNGKITTIICN